MSIEVIFDEAAAEIIREVTARMAATGANATGKTVRSLEDNVTDEQMQILGSKSFLFVEEGRKPGKRPPIDPLKEWLKARGLDEAMVWPLANAIAKRGTLSRRADGQATAPRDIYTGVVTKLRVERIISQINQFKVTQMKSEIIEAFRGPGVNIV